MIARNEAKMREKCTELEKRHPSIKAIYIIADFSKLSSIHEYEQTIARPLQYIGIDVGALFCNAGVVNPGNFVD